MRLVSDTDIRRLLRIELEKRKGSITKGNGLKMLLGRPTTNRFAGLATGLGVTAVIQSSSATTVMVVGFFNTVNSKYIYQSRPDSSSEWLCSFPDM